jgi:hypothetical protein
MWLQDNKCGNGMLARSNGAIDNASIDSLTALTTRSRGFFPTSMTVEERLPNQKCATPSASR